MALVTTPGAADANSYADLSFADTYNAAHPYGSTWTGGTPEKEARMIVAVRVLDGWPRSYTGAAASATQALAWPRIGMLNRNGFAIAETVIPDDLKRAQCELARKIGETDLTANNDIVNQAIKSIAVGPIHLAFEGLNPINSRNVARIQRELDAMTAMLPDAVKLLLVPSWLLPDAEAIPPLLFESL